MEGGVSHYRVKGRISSREEKEGECYEVESEGIIERGGEGSHRGRRKRESS